MSVLIALERSRVTWHVSSKYHPSGESRKTRMLKILNHIRMRVPHYCELKETLTGMTPMVIKSNILKLALLRKYRQLMFSNCI